MEKLDISQVPALALFQPFKLSPELTENPSPQVLTEKIEKQNEFFKTMFFEEKQKAFAEIEDLVRQPFFAFIKGTA